MPNFARIIQVDENTQVLIVKEWDNENDSYSLRQTTEHDSYTASVKVGFGDSDEEEQMRDKLFEEYSIKHAKQFIEQTTY